jgi:hypothetical protein
MLFGDAGWTTLPRKDPSMEPAKKSLIVVNLLYWAVAALLHPLANLIPTASGEPPKVFSLLIPMMFIGLAFGSTAMMARALGQQKSE